MADESPIPLSGGPPETRLPPAPAVARERLQAALEAAAEERRAAVAEVAAAFPRYLDAWASLGDLGRDQVESYAYFRVGYHRGLDALRGAGWRGTGYVRWAEESNRGFLRCLEGLSRVAGSMGETDEAERCRQFLRQLDPGWRGTTPDG
ncbi:MAG TPA: DUF3151 family protein [Acidimicrobiales bacterium]|nr:DUF3151 family protein [Acidimicrobiales bacterium]